MGRIHFLFFSLFLPFATSTPTQNNGVLSADLLHHFAAGHKTANVFISFNAPSPSSVLERIQVVTDVAERAVKITLIKESLEAHAYQTQKDVSSYLIEKYPEVVVKSLWISNQLYVKGVSAEGLAEAAEKFFIEIKSIRLERFHEYVKPEINKSGPVNKSSPKAEWGVDKIGAEEAVEMLRNLTGGNIPEIRVAVMSTGAQATHTTIRSTFYGREYGWYDPNSGETAPFDEVGVGSHEIGVIAGTGGVGVFPLAKWMACRSCAFSGCGEYAIFRCAEVLACPVLQNDTMPRCDLAPHVVHADWWTGDSGDGFFDEALTVWRSAGIIPVWPVGGGGPACLSVRYPSESALVLSIGGTTPEDAWYERSSSGPVPGKTIIKPELTAPATNVLSAWNLDDLTLVPLSATSCASAHVAGVVALLKAYREDLSFAQIFIALARGAVTEGLHLADGVVDGECGGKPIEEFPNFSLGFGRLSAVGALRYVVEH